MHKSEVNNLDKLWSNRVKSPGRCEYCGTTEKKLEAAHIVGRIHRTTRWGTIIAGKYDSNGMCLCFSCHQAFDQHLEPEKYIREKVIGADRYERLTNTKKEIAKHQDFDTIKERILNG